MKKRDSNGDIAQLGERLPCKQEVAGSIPTISTNEIPVQSHRKAQRSGFSMKRRGSEMSELSPKAEARDMEHAATTGP